MSAEIATALYTATLPSDPATFKAELALWHPNMEAGRYLERGTYPRCWVVMSAILVAMEFTEYARGLHGTLARTVLRESDRSIAENSVINLDHANWRAALCHLGTGLYFFSPGTMLRAFTSGLQWVFAHPDQAGGIANIMRSDPANGWDERTSAAAELIRRNPVSAVTGSPRSLRSRTPQFSPLHPA